MTDNVTQAETRGLIKAIINAYHTTRLDSDYVPCILSKDYVQSAFAAFAKEATPSASVERFEAWWSDYKHANRDAAPYSIKKQIGWDAFEAALTLPVPSAPRGG